jgi:hypothetical protein
MVLGWMIRMAESDMVTIPVMLYSQHCKICNSPYRLWYEHLALVENLPNARITEWANKFGDEFSAMSLGRHLRKHTKKETKVYINIAEGNMEDVRPVDFSVAVKALIGLSPEWISKLRAHWESKDIDANQYWTKDSLREIFLKVFKEIELPQKYVDSFLRKYQQELAELS